VYWLQRPPYLRWTAAALLLLAALAWDLRQPATELMPFAARAVQAGEAIDAAAVEWREVPAHLLPPVDLSTAFAAVDLDHGDPLVEGVLRGPLTTPDGWLEIPVETGANPGPGDQVVLVITEPPATVPGLVIDRQEGDAYSLDFRPAVVAVPAESAALVAAAAAGGTLVVAVKP
jgi:hypothetical protein